MRAEVPRCRRSRGVLFRWADDTSRIRVLLFPWPLDRVEPHWASAGDGSETSRYRSDHRVPRQANKTHCYLPDASVSFVRLDLRLVVSFCSAGSEAAPSRLERESCRTRMPTAVVGHSPASRNRLRFYFPPSHFALAAWQVRPVAG